MNRVDLIGRLTRTPELKYTNSGKAVARANLAVNRRFKRDEADFITLVAWEKTAELMANHLDKGSRIGIEGRIETGSYEKDGRKVYTTEVVVDQLHFLDSKGEQQESRQQQQDSPYQPVDDSVDVRDSDLPF